MKDADQTLKLSWYLALWFAPVSVSIASNIHLKQVQKYQLGHNYIQLILFHEDNPLSINASFSEAAYVNPKNDIRACVFMVW